jgi:hypothetical protein
MPELYPEDQEKVNRYLSASIHQVERKPFRPLLLLGVIMASMGVLTLVAWLLARSHGVV